MEPNGEMQQPPMLLIPDDHLRSKQKQFVYSVAENQYLTTNVRQWGSLCILGSGYGWLVFVDMLECSCFLWNPTSLETIVLPEVLPCAIDYCECVLSKPPTDPDCCILFNSTWGPLSFCRIGDNEFVTKTNLTDDDDDVALRGQHLSAIRSFRGKIYGLTIPDYRFVTIEFVGKTLLIRPILIEKEGGPRPWHIPQPSWASRHNCRNYLVESPPSCGGGDGDGGELLLVHQMFQPFIYDNVRVEKARVAFRVFVVDMDRKECMERDKIGKQTIFISDVGDGFCCSSSSSSRVGSNCIYYTIKDNRDLYIYDLEYRSTTTLLPCRDVKRSSDFSFWLPHKLACKLID